jgi:hypothetical protein
MHPIEATYLQSFVSVTTTTIQQHHAPTIQTIDLRYYDTTCLLMMSRRLFGALNYPPVLSVCS